MSESEISIEKLPLKDRMENLIEIGGNLYNNLFATVRIGNRHLSEPIFDLYVKRLIRGGQELSSEDKESKEYYDRYTKELSEEVEKAGISQDESERFRKILMTPIDQATEDEYEFLECFLIKINRVYDAMINRGWKTEDLKQ